MLHICWIKLLSYVLGGTSFGIGEVVGSAAFWEFLRRNGVSSRKDLTQFLESLKEDEPNDAD